MQSTNTLPTALDINNMKTPRLNTDTFARDYDKYGQTITKMNIVNNLVRNTLFCSLWNKQETNYLFDQIKIGPVLKGPRWVF